MDNVKTILDHLEYLHPEPETVFEICILASPIPRSDFWEGNAYGQKNVIAGWFDDKQKAAILIDKIDRTIKPNGIYVTLNPVNATLLGRANNRLKAGISRTTDKEIVAIRNILIDGDALRPAGISATEAEKAAAQDVITAAKSELQRYGVSPAIFDSGNGYHAQFKVDLPNEPENVELVKGLLLALNQRLGNDLVKIDQAVFNPGRITKIAGTFARKGDHTAERPHRRAQTLEMPANPVIVGIDTLRAIVATGQQSTSSSTTKDPGPGPFNVAGYLARFGYEVIKVKNHGTSVLHVLNLSAHQN